MKDELLKLADELEHAWHCGEVFDADGFTERLRSLAAQHADARGGRVEHACEFCKDTGWLPGAYGGRCWHCQAGTPSPEPPTAAEPAKHWHDLYRKECRLRQDDAARYGQQIVDLEEELTRRAGEGWSTTDAGREDADPEWLRLLETCKREGQLAVSVDPKMLRAIIESAITPAGGEDGARLEFVLRRIQGTGLRALVGVLSDTSDLSEFRSAIDAAISAERGAGEGRSNEG
jgi:hypothetical protein